MRRKWPLEPNLHCLEREKAYHGKMARRLAYLVAAWVGLGLPGSSVLADAPAVADCAWVARAWQLDDGLPDNNVTGVAQTSEGYLWLSTHRGLIRFDGVRFQSIHLPNFPKGTHPLIRGMCLGHEDRVWLALEGALAVSLKPGASNEFASVRGLSSFRPQSVAESGDGGVWIGYSDASACRIADGKVTHFTARDGLEGIGYCWLASDITGQLWFALAGRVGVFRKGRFEALLNLREKPVCIGRARAGGIWICAGARLFQYTEGRGLVETWGVDAGLRESRAIGVV